MIPKNTYEKIFGVKVDKDKLINKLKGNNKLDMNDSNNWKANCSECGGIMDYFNLRYGCRKCGHIMEV